MSSNGTSGNERSKAAAWVWYQRAASSSRAHRIGDLLKSRRRKSSSRHELEQFLASRGITRQPSRFKREAAAALHDDRSLQLIPPSPAATPEHPHADQSHPASAQNLTVHSSEHSTQQSAAACRDCKLSPQPAAAVDHCAQCRSRRSPAPSSNAGQSPPRRKSESSPRPVQEHWPGKLLGIRRKSFSSSRSSADPYSHTVCNTDLEIDSSTSFAESFPRRFSGEAAASVPAFPGSPTANCMSSLLDSFELHAILQKLGYEADDHDFEERTLRCLQEAHHHDIPSPSPPAHCRQSLYDLLRWSERGLNMKGCSCNIEEEDHSSDHYYHDAESPDINNIGGCSSGVAGAQVQQQQQQRRRRRRRPSIFMSNIPQSFSTALHHMHLPHLPHAFSTALHHLPQSFSIALHHITHSVSSAYQHLHTATHRQTANDSGGTRHFDANDGGALPFDSNAATTNHHHVDVPASPAHHHTHAHRHLIPAHLRHLLSFKTHRSPSHPSRSPTLDSVSQTANCHMATPGLAVQHSLKSFPSFHQLHLSESDDYMLIYSTAKDKLHTDHGGMQHHHHHHYHHHHYIL